MQLLEISHAYKFLGGFYLAMSVLHVILFLYNPTRKANLIYAAGMFMVFLNFTFTQQAILWSGAYKANVLTDLAANGALLYYVSNYVIARTMPVFKKPVQYFGWLYAGGFLLLVINFQLDIFDTPLETILRSAIYLVIGASCIIGLVKRLSNFHFIVIATLLLILMWVFCGTDIFNIWGGNYPPLRVSFILLGFISPGIAYSFYLSRYLSQTKKNLKEEYIINDQLSLINRQAEKIKDLDQAKSRFFANISHEFRTPLTLLLGPIEKRLNVADDHDDKTELASMHRNASRLLTLVNQLLDLSRLEGGTLKLKCRHADLPAVILSVSSQFSSMADSKEIEFEILAKQPVYLFFDLDKLEKIITNLLSNAFKFTPSGGSIMLSITQQDPTENFKHGYAQIDIADTGTGIEEEHLDKIFDRFYQVDMSSTRSYEGSGIGLSLTKELIELHHGSISFTSTFGQGSVFTVKLPLGNSHLSAEEILEGDIEKVVQETNEAFSLSVLEEPLKKKSPELPRILLVEDNADLRYYLTKSLREQFNLMEAEDGEQGISLAIQEVPDLIISDLMMPKVNGMQLCQQLKENEKTSHIPIIMLTAKADQQTKIGGLETGADDYIYKPFEMTELLARINNLIGNRKLMREKFSKQILWQSGEIKLQSQDDHFLKKIMDIIELNLTDYTFSVEKMADEAAMSQIQLYRKVKALTGLPPNDLIRQLRLKRAADMLLNNTGNVTDVAYQVGFNNLSYFAKCFKDTYGVSPKHYSGQPAV